MQKMSLSELKSQWCLNVMLSDFRSSIKKKEKDRIRKFGLNLAKVEWMHVQGNLASIRKSKCYFNKFKLLRDYSVIEEISATTTFKRPCEGH